MPCLSHANVHDVFSSLFGRPEKQVVKTSYEYRPYKSVNAEDSSHTLSSQSHDLSTSMPLNSDRDHYWKLLPGFEYREINTNALFPSGRVFPRRLWNPSLGASLYHLYSSGNSLVGSFAVSSPSDQPFSEWKNVAVQGTFVFKKIVDADTSWLFFIFFSNNRGILDYVPLPGVAYAFRPTKNLHLVLGIPFVSAIWSATDSFLITAFYLPPLAGSLKASYFLFGPAHIFAQIKTQTKSYFLNNRAIAAEKFFDLENVVQGGFSVPLEQHILVDISAGNSFGRKFFLGTQRKDQNSSQVRRTDNALFADAKLVVNF